MQANSQQNSQTSHFDLHVSGIWYLNRVRWVEPSSRNGGRKAERFLACSVSALHGPVESPSSTYLDLRVSGGEAIEMVDSLKADVDARKKVFISFRVGDIYPHVYDRKVRDEKGHETGEWETKAIIKGRLLLINSITIDGQRVFTRAAQDGDDSGVDQGQPDPMPVEASRPVAPPQAVQPEPAPANAAPQGVAYRWKVPVTAASAAPAFGNRAAYGVTA